MDNKAKGMLLVKALVIAALLLVISWGGLRPATQNNSPTVEPVKISAEQAKEMMADNAEIILLDVRTEDEYKESHIEGALLIPDYEIALRAESELADKDAVILIYCRSGRRSAIAAEALADMGYSNVYDFGGILDWPYETVSE